MKSFILKSSQIAATTFIATLAAFAAIAPAARAQVTFTLASGPGPNAQSITITANGHTGNTDSGPYSATVGGIANVPVYCVDATHDINYGESYAANVSYKITDAAGSLNAAGYYDGGLASAIIADYGASFAAGSTDAQKIAMAQARASQVAWLSDNFYNATTFGSGDPSIANNQTAITASIWDIVQNGANGAYTPGSSFVLDTPGYSSLINYFEGLAAAHSNYTSSTAVWVQAPTVNGTHPQDFIAIIPVPEPGVVVTATSLFGMVGMGLVRGRRRTIRTAKA